MDPILTSFDTGLNFDSLLGFILDLFRKNKKIFLIHGHDDTNLSFLREMLFDFDLDPVVMKDLYDFSAETLIEKFEKMGAKCDYAIALYTPDDLVKKEGSKYFQARPNVIYELGWFCGKIGRNKVMIIMQVGTTIFSDFNGIHQVTFKKDVKETYKAVHKALKAKKILH